MSPKFVPLDHETIEAKAPAALRGKKLTKKERVTVGASDKLEFFSTEKTIEAMGKMGWRVVEAMTPNSKDEDRRKLGKHIMYFRKQSFMSDLQVGGLFPEIIITNAHDGTAAFKFHMGLYRLVCKNGLVIRDRQLDERKFRHIHIDFDFVRSMVRETTDRMEQKLQLVSKWQKIRLDEKEQLQYATRALAARFTDPKDGYINRYDRTINLEKLQTDFRPVELLQVVRDEDQGDDLFKVYNRVQENLTKGNFKSYRTEKREPHLREVYEMRRNLLMNKELWEITENFATQLS